VQGHEIRSDDAFNLARARCACLEFWIFHEIDNLVNVGDVLEADPVHGNHLEFAHGGGMGVFLVLAEPTSRNPFGIFARAPPLHCSESPEVAAL
jgi:hypothetical protein